MIPGLTSEEEVLELESQIRLLNAKVAAAVDRAADLEDAIRQYKQRERAQQAAATTITTAESQDGSAEPASALRRMSTFMFSNKRSSGPPVVGATENASGPMSPTSPRKQLIDDSLPLAVQLTKERQLRMQAEQNYALLQQESEDLSQSLFEEANKMVAAERKLNHQVTEKLKMLADREEERTARLRHLEGAMERILRVRGVLAASPVTPMKQQQPSPVAMRSPAAMIAAAQQQEPRVVSPKANPTSPGRAIVSGYVSRPPTSPTTVSRPTTRSPPQSSHTSPVPRLRTNTSMQQAREAAQASITAQAQQDRAVDAERAARQARVAAAANRISKAKLQPRPARTYGQGTGEARGVPRRPVPDLRRSSGDGQDVSIGGA